MTNSINYKNTTRIIEKDNQRLIRKRRKIDNKKIYEYLKLKEFNNFIPPYLTTNEYEFFTYIDETNIPKEDKAIEIINTLSMLHIKTTTYQETNIDNIKRIYEETKQQIDDLRYYYYNLQDIIEYKIYPSPEEQLLLFNISNFYKALNYAEHKIETWYKEKEKSKQERVVLIHNNITLEHALYNEKINLISWNYAKKDYPVYDFINLYKHEFRELEMISLFKIYSSKFQYTIEEKLLFESFIAIPPKVIFNKSSLINTINTRKAVDYVLKTNDFLLEYNKEDQKSYNDKFE